MASSHLLLLPSLAALLLFPTGCAFGPPPPLPAAVGRQIASSGRGSRDVHRVASTHQRPRTHHTSPWTRLQLANIDDDDESEWRAFRAKLVRDGLPSLGDAGSRDDAALQNDDADARPNCNDGYAHETTPLVEVGSVLLSIPTTDLCQALDQQYWHRSVVIITEVSDNVVSGEAENEVPEEQLAMGDRRGRWSYRGIMLNRCTDGLLPGDVDGTTGEEGRGQIAASGDGNGWRIHRGGDLLGLDSAAGTEFACLHHLGFGDPDVRSASTKLVGHLGCTTLDEAQRLCREHPTKYRTEDFLTYAGFCKWRPSQLEREMGPERREWRALSVDGRSIWDELQLQREQSEAIIEREGGKGTEVAEGLLQTGTGMWRRFLQKIDVSESKATERLPSGQLAFYDRMLRVWAEEKLTVDRTDPLLHTKLEDGSKALGPGTIVRATSPPTSDVLLYEAEFIRSLVLVIEDTSDATVGIVLNHPMAAAVECREGEDPLPLRYGGPIDVPSWRDGSYKETWEDDGEDEKEDDEVYEGFLDYQSGAVSFEDIVFDEIGDSLGLDEDDDDSSFLWIHRDARLGWQRPNGGTRLGTSNLRLIKEDDALRALLSGSLRAEDVMIFAGVCIWEKGAGVGACGGLREQVDAIGSFEIVRAGNRIGGDEASNGAWDILSKRQTVLSKDTLSGNIAAAIDAWQAFWNSEANAELTVPDDKDARTRLSEAALKAWVGVNLLEDPLGTLVEVRDDQRLEQ